MKNLAVNQEKLYNSSSKIYFRQANGTSFVTSYDPNKNITQLLEIFYKQKQPAGLNLMCKGKKLQLQKNLIENNVNPNLVIHIFDQQTHKQQRQRSIIYVHYQEKLYEIQFKQDELVSELKKNIEQETSVPTEKQVLLYKEQFLQNDKLLKHYQIKAENILKMGKIQNKQQNFQTQFQMPNTIISVKLNSRNRRGSADDNLILGQPNKVTPQETSKFAKSVFHFVEKLKNNDEEGTCNQFYNLGLSPIDCSESSSKVFQENEDNNFKFEFAKWSGLKIEGSDKADSPLNSINIQQTNFHRFTNGKKKNVFKSGNIFEGMQNIDPQQIKPSFGREDDELNLDKIMRHRNQNGQNQPSLQAAFQQLMGPGKQQVIFCQSYYQKEVQQSPVKRPNQVLANSYNYNLQDPQLFNLETNKQQNDDNLKAAFGQTHKIQQTANKQ